MGHFDDLKKIKEERVGDSGVSSLFRITHLNSPTIFETDKREIGGTLKLAGISFSTVNEDVLEELNQQLHFLMASISSDFMVYFHEHKKKEEFLKVFGGKSTFTKGFNKAYSQSLKSSFFKKDFYLTFLIKGRTDTNANKGATILQKILGNKVKEAANQQRAKNIQKLKQVMLKAQKLLQGYGAYILGTKDESLGVCELINFLGLVINAGEPTNLKGLISVDTNTNNNDLKKAYYPNGQLNQFIPKKRLYISDAIQFQGGSKKDVKFAAMLSLKNYPSATDSMTMDALQDLNEEYLITHTFIPLGKASAIDTINKQGAKLASADDLAISQRDDLVDLQDEIASENCTLGLHHHTMMLFSKDLETLEDKVLETINAYSQSGIIAIREGITCCEGAFWSQIPGNQSLIARSKNITSLNFANLIAMHQEQSGKAGNFLGDSVALLKSLSSSPIHFNFHRHGNDKNNPPAAHFLIVGSNGDGKTTNVLALDALAERFNRKTFILDRRQATRIYVLACGGIYNTVSPSSKDLSLNPLQLEESKENRDFLITLIGRLCKKENELSVSADILSQITDGIDYLYNLEKEERTLSALYDYFPKNFERLAELSLWVKGDEENADGKYAWAFDNEIDNVNLSLDKIGFDLEYLLDSNDETLTTPVYLYLLHKIKTALNGDLATIIIDECQQVIKDPFWKETLDTFLPTIRKQNCSLQMIFQDLKKVEQSGVGDVITNNMGGMMIFPNKKADADLYQRFLKLNETEIAFILESNPKKRLFLYKGDGISTIAQFDLSFSPEALRVFSANDQSNQLLDDIIEEKGPLPENWLETFINRSNQDA